jgi:phosphatidate phosphatase APP1
MVIRLGAQRYAMAPSEPNGHFYSELRLDQSTVAALSKDHTLTFSLLLDAESQRSFAGRVRIADDTGIAVISDIDDTVKVTQVTDHKKMLENTFFNDFVAVQGMAQLYRAWAAQGASIHFVTSSPWQLYLPLKDFLAREHFPPATFSMKYFRFFDSTFFDIFKSGGETKPAQIEPILRALPGYRFILVGDSGEQDPQVYAALAKQNPEKIARIYIRKVESSPERDYRAVFSGIPDDKWRLFSSAAELRSLPFP